MALSIGSPQGMTVTNLHSLAANNGAWLTGWGSASIACDGANVVDCLISVELTRASSNLQAGVINVYVVAAYDNTPTWPDLLSSGTEGTQGAVTLNSVTANGASMVLLASMQTEATGSGIVVGVSQRSVAALFGGVLPPSDIFLFITTNSATSTNAAFAASGNKVTYHLVSDS